MPLKFLWESGELAPCANRRVIVLTLHAQRMCVWMIGRSKGKKGEYHIYEQFKRNQKKFGNLHRNKKRHLLASSREHAFQCTQRDSGGDFFSRTSGPSPMPSCELCDAWQKVASTAACSKAYTPQPGLWSAIFPHMAAPLARVATLPLQ